MLKLALASPPFAGTIEGAMPWVERYIADAAQQGADIVCFPEAYVPGLRGVGRTVDNPDAESLHKARDLACEWAARHRIMVILPMEWLIPDGRVNTAVVISACGKLLGQQTKNQVAPEEDPHYVPGRFRAIFEVKGIPFGIAICHEGWRYPETVRWAALHGARIVFHPQLTGDDSSGIRIDRFCDPASPYYEKAMVCRTLENGIFFASINYGLAYPDSATCVISPDGDCIARLPYGEAGVLVAEIDPDEATGLYARRFAPDTYRAAGE